MKAEADQRGWVLLTDGEEVGPVRMGVARTPENGLVVLLQDEDEIHLTPTMLRTMIDLMDQGIEPADPVMELTVPQVENLAPTAKAIMDGLRDAGVLPEDDTTHIPVVTFRSAVGPPSVDVIMERC